jgi:hypothetical protein
VSVRGAGYAVVVERRLPETDRTAA